MLHGRQPLQQGICKPLNVLAVDADIAAGTDLLGKVVANLQTGITVGTDAITGTLKYVTGYTGFSGDVSEQSGNYLALHAACSGADSITVKWGANGTEKTLDADGLMVLRITNKDTQVLYVTAKKSGEPDYVKAYSLAGLTLEAAGG